MLQFLFQGLAFGSIYMLIALGFVQIYRATNVVNFAQGDFAMVGAFVMVALSEGTGLSYGLCFLIALIAMAVFGLLFELGVYYPLRNRSFLPVIISTIGASILMQNGVLAIAGPHPHRLDGIFKTVAINAGGVSLSTQFLVILVVAFALVIAQHVFFEHTLVGKQMQATSQDKDMARLLGIPVAVMIALTFIYATALGGLAGLLLAPVLFVTTGMSSILGLKAFAATIIGGFGDVKGAIVGGLGLGLVESLAGGYISATFKDAFAFLVLFLFLLVRPQGIFGEKVAEKA